MKKILNNKLFLLITNLTFMVSLFILNVFYQYHNFNFTLKCIGSAIFATLGLINLLFALLRKEKNIIFYIIMAGGLIFAMLGDIIINSDFIIGAAVFAIGHIFFVIAYFFENKFHYLDLIISGTLSIATTLIILFLPVLKFDEPILQIVCIIYGIIISFMLGKATSNFINNRNTLHFFIMIASLLFFISDAMLLLSWFSDLGGTGRKWLDNVCMGTYYPALIFLAMSLYLKMYPITIKK